MLRLGKRVRSFFFCFSSESFSYAHKIAGGVVKTQPESFSLLCFRFFLAVLLASVVRQTPSFEFEYFRRSLRCCLWRSQACCVVLLCCFSRKNLFFPLVFMRCFHVSSAKVMTSRKKVSTVNLNFQSHHRSPTP